MLFFIDESGTNHQNVPYEVLGGIAISEANAWPMIQALRQEQLRQFGVLLLEVKPEFKGSRLLQREYFRRASLLTEIPLKERRILSKNLLERGAIAKAQGAAGQNSGKRELVAYAQSCLAYSQQIFELCQEFKVKVFTMMVEPNAPKPKDDSYLRKDFAYLFERFFYAVEDRGTREHGLIVFEELDKTQSAKLSARMRTYFEQTLKGRNRSKRILPEAFFVHSDLTTLVQVADVVIYCLNWGYRFGKARKPTRSELESFGIKVARLGYQGKRDSRAVRGIVYLDDLRPAGEKQKNEGNAFARASIRNYIPLFSILFNSR